MHGYLNYDDLRHYLEPEPAKDLNTIMSLTVMIECVVLLPDSNLKRGVKFLLS